MLWDEHSVKMRVEKRAMPKAELMVWWLVSCSVLMIVELTALHWTDTTALMRARLKGIEMALHLESYLWNKWDH